MIDGVHYSRCGESQRLMLLVQPKNTLEEIRRKIGEYGSQDFFELYYDFSFNTKNFIEGIDYYVENGKYVFTEKFLKERGFCCKNGCRHCPYGFKKAVK